MIFFSMSVIPKTCNWTIVFHCKTIFEASKNAVGSAASIVVSDRPGPWIAHRAVFVKATPTSFMEVPSPTSMTTNRLMFDYTDNRRNKTSGSVSTWPFRVPVRHVQCGTSSLTIIKQFSRPGIQTDRPTVENTSELVTEPAIQHVTARSRNQAIYKATLANTAVKSRQNFTYIECDDCPCRWFVHISYVVFLFI